MLGIIGGTGLYQIPGLQIDEELPLSTPFGDPSGVFIRGRLGEKEVLFLSRHGTGHKLLPHEINYRANIFGLKHLGATAILSVSAVGSLCKEFRPGDFVLPDQYLDLTKGRRETTFFGKGVAAHVATAQPISKILQDLLHTAVGRVENLGRSFHRNGTYACVEGPRLGTQAESHMLKNLGAHLVGMTNVPEVFLAREAQLAYCTLAIVTDYDSWLEDPTQHVDVSQVFALYKESLSAVVKAIENFIPLYSDNLIESCPSRNALKNALLTSPESISAEWKSILEILRK
ncbi:MAG: S-methyl-5'-thioadenosine phosphorylase [Bacteriovoracia bacterium]